MLRSSIFVLLFVLSLCLACSTPSWFPLKKGPPHKAKMKELLHQEVVIIDREEYVKVLNPNASEGRDQPKYLYIPVDEYLSKRQAFATAAPIAHKEETRKEFAITPTQPSPSGGEKETSPVSPSVSTLPNLKKKVLMPYLDDRTTNADEVLGDWMAEKLTREINQRSQQVLFIDYQLVTEFLQRRGAALTDLEAPETLHMLNEVLGVHALVVGYLSGPYVFATRSGKDQSPTATAIIKIEIRIVDTLSGKTLKNLSASNPIMASRETGGFSEERAKSKAIDFAIKNISRALSKELDSLDWFCRVSKVEDEEIYINAGRLSGLRVGDVMEVFQPQGAGTFVEVPGKIQISAFLGIDASMGKLIDGKKPDVNDILKLAKSKGT